MTMQKLDTFMYRGVPAEAIAISRKFLFSPSYNFDIETTSWTTSNYRGFWCDYAIDEALVVKNLYLFSKNHQYPTINGKVAEEIPDFVGLLTELNKKARKPMLYHEGFPMQYMGINYECDYTGNIVLGVDPSQNKAGQRCYRKVYDLAFEVGILIESTDITEKWRLSINQKNKEASKYWWEDENHNYYYLINYGLMGVNSLQNRESISG